eukprot:6213055-Pleurochrysis_carterae.AAC.2
MILQLRTLVATLSTFSPRTVKHTTLRTVLAVAAEHDLDVQGGDVTQGYPQADWPTDQKAYAHIPEGYKKRDKNGREMVAEVGYMYTATAPPPDASGTRRPSSTRASFT